MEINKILNNMINNTRNIKIKIEVNSLKNGIIIDKNRK